MQNEIFFFLNHIGIKSNMQVNLQDVDRETHFNLILCCHLVVIKITPAPAAQFAGELSKCRLES